MAERLDIVPNLKPRPSVYAKDGDGHLSNPSMRRVSRFHPRQSVQYDRRMSQISRSSVTGSSVGGTKTIGLIPPKLQNTYRLEPTLQERFKPETVAVVIKDVLNECLDGEKYNPTQCRSLSQMLADLIKNRVKDMGFHRYKYVVTVNMGQDRGQGFSVGSRSLWNKDTDNFAEAHYHQDGLYASATVYALYCD